MSVSRGQLNKAYVSAVNFLDQRDINPNIIDVANDTQFLDTMRLLGRTKKCKMTTYRNFVNTDLYPTITVGTTSGSGSATVTTALTAGNLFLRTSDLVSFPNEKVGIVFSLTTTSSIDTLVIKSVDGSNLTLVSGNALQYAGNAVGEESDSLTNRRYDVTPYFNLIQAFREIDTQTDIQKMSPVEVTYNGSSYYGMYEHAKKVQSLKASVDIAMIQGVQSVTQFGDASPALVDAAGKPIQTTMGLNQYTTTYGISDTVTTPGTLVTADMDDLATQLNAAKAPLDYMGYCSDAAARVYYTYFKGLNSAGIYSGKLELDGKTIDLTIDKYKYGTRTYEFIPLPIFNHPKVLSASIKKAIYWIPKGKVNVEGGSPQPRIQIRYKEHGFAAGNEMIGEFHSGALAPQPNGTVANWAAHWETYQGLECLGVQHFVKQVVAA